MKTIRLTQITTSGTLYRIHLGNGYIFQFKSLRSARSFLGETNSFLTSVLLDINYQYKLIYSRYRDNWPLFFHNKKSFQNQCFADNNRIENVLRSVADLLDHAFKMAPTVNGSTWVFCDMVKSIDYLEETLIILSKYHKKRSETVLIYEIKTSITRLSELKFSVLNYGNLKATGKHTRVIEMMAHDDFIEPVYKNIS